MTHETTVIRYPNGKYGFVGSVPTSLAFTQSNGEPLTEKQVEVIKHCGPGLISRYVKHVTFDTKAAAEEALQSFLSSKEVL
jgi:hypothetical protein